MTPAWRSTWRLRQRRGDSPCRDGPPDVPRLQHPGHHQWRARPDWTHPSFGRLFQGVAPDWAAIRRSWPWRTSCPMMRVGGPRRGQEGFAGRGPAADRCRDATRPADSIAFARRMTGYKRPDLLFDRHRPAAAIHRGADLPAGDGGQGAPAGRGRQGPDPEIHGHMRQLRARSRCFPAQLRHGVAKPLVAGADVWLNTPLPPLEASGTSGMKAALNGVLEPERPRWLVGRGLHRGGDRLGDRPTMATARRTATTPGTSTTRWRTVLPLYTTTAAAGSG